MKLLPVCKEHLPALAALEERCFHAPWSEEALGLLLTEDAFGVALEENGEILAYAGTTAVLDEGAITNVATHPDHRRRGFGEAVLSELLRVGAARGLRIFSLEVRESNLGAIALYEKLGFAVVGKRPRFYTHPSEAALIMILELPEQRAEP